MGPREVLPRRCPITPSKRCGKARSKLIKERLADTLWPPPNPVVCPR
jgi:hypothetical protein